MSALSSISQKIGLVCVIFYFLLGVASITMAGISYTTLATKWASTPFKHLAPLDLAVTIFLTFCSFLGIITFTACSKAKSFIVFVIQIF